MTTETLHPVAQAYLAELQQRCLSLPPEQAAELVSDIAGHLREALAPDAPEVEVRTVLDRLGSPAELVAASGAPAAVPLPPATTAYAVAPYAATPARFGAVETLTLVSLLAAELLFVLYPVAAVVWLLGVVLLASSQWWSPRQKLWGALGLATGFPVLFSTMLMPGGQSSCTAVMETTSRDGTVSTGPQTSTCVTEGGLPDWAQPVAIGLLVAYLCFQGWTVWRLTRRP